MFLFNSNVILIPLQTCPNIHQLLCSAWLFWFLSMQSVVTKHCEWTHIPYSVIKTWCLCSQIYNLTSPLYQATNQSINHSNLFLRLRSTACHGRQCFVLKTPTGSETVFSIARFNAGLRSAGAEQTRDHGAQQDALDVLAMRTGEVPVSHQFLSHFFATLADPRHNQ